MKLNINPNSSLNMKELAITAIIKAYQLEELNEADRMLVKAAMDATKAATPLTHGSR